MQREMEPTEAVTSEQFDAAVQAEQDRTAPHGFDWRREYSAAEQAEREAEDAAFAVAFAAEWTAEVTASRRAEWNALVRSGALSDAKGKVHPRKLSDQERAQGWTVEDLKAAVARHS